MPAADESLVLWTAMLAVLLLVAAAVMLIHDIAVRRQGARAPGPSYVDASEFEDFRFLEPVAYHPFLRPGRISRRRRLLPPIEEEDHGPVRQNTSGRSRDRRRSRSRSRSRRPRSRSPDAGSEPRSSLAREPSRTDERDSASGEENY